MIAFFLSLFLPAKRDLWRTPTYCELLQRARRDQARRNVAELEHDLSREETRRARNENMRREKRVQFGLNFPSIIK